MQQKSEQMFNPSKFKVLAEIDALSADVLRKRNIFKKAEMELIAKQRQVDALIQELRREILEPTPEER